MESGGGFWIRESGIPVRLNTFVRRRARVTMFVLCAVEPGHVDAYVGAMARRGVRRGDACVLDSSSGY